MFNIAKLLINANSMKKQKYFFCIGLLTVMPAICQAQFGAAVLQGLRNAVNNSINSGPSQGAGNGSQAVLPVDAGGDGQQKTMLEIKMMQTRVFERSPQEVVDGIKEFWTNRGGICSGTRPVYQAVNVQGIPPNPKPKNAQDAMPKYAYESIQGSSKVVCNMASDNTGKPNTGFNWQYELSLEPIPYDGKPVDYGVISSLPTRPAKKVIVRARDYVNNGATLLINEETYSVHFKSLADALFTNAIALNPQEIQ